VSHDFMSVHALGRRRLTAHYGMPVTPRSKESSTAPQGVVCIVLTLSGSVFDSAARQPHSLAIFKMHRTRIPNVDADGAKAASDSPRSRHFVQMMRRRHTSTKSRCPDCESTSRPAECRRHLRDNWCRVYATPGTHSPVDGTFLREVVCRASRPTWLFIADTAATHRGERRTVALLRI
jgi:hypothetical protein